MAAATAAPAPIAASAALVAAFLQQLEQARSQRHCTAEHVEEGARHQHHVRDGAPAAVLQEKHRWILPLEWYTSAAHRGRGPEAAVVYVGLLPPSRHALSNRLLNEEYDAVRAVDISRLAQQKLIQLPATLLQCSRSSLA